MLTIKDDLSLYTACMGSYLWFRGTSRELSLLASEEIMSLTYDNLSLYSADKLRLTLRNDVCH